MSVVSPSSEHLARVRDEARRLLERAGDSEAQLQALLQLSETGVRHIEAVLSQVVHAPDVDVEQIGSVFSLQLQRGVAAAQMARRVRVGAREQSLAARRLLTRLEDDMAAEQRSSPHRRDDSVLVVDDYGEVRELLAYVLLNAGFAVRTAANGLEGLLAAYEMRPAVIVMDVVMPVLDGVEATRLIKATETTRHARVIAYTSGPPLADSASEQLFAAVLQKPTSPDSVVATVKRVACL